MAKKKISKLSDKDDNFFKSLSLKERKLAVSGKWDSSDTYNLQLLFEQYDKANGGKLKRFCNQLRLERALNKRDETFIAERGIMGASATHNTIAFALPEDLQMFMEKYFPTIWTNPEHSREFVKRFPMFRR